MLFDEIMPADTEISSDKIETLLKGITIPSPPQIIADLQLEMAMPDPDLNAMADMISRDPGLAGGVLKILNSPFYGGRKIGSISQAVMLLGMNTVTNIVNTLYLRDCMKDNVSDEAWQIVTRFWDSAVDVAKACQLVAQRVRYPAPDQAYMLGLFHNVGIPLLMQRFDNYAEVLVRSYELDAPRIVDTENAMLDSNHAVISFYTARSWKLPALICKVIAEHHNVNEIFSEQDSTDNEEKYLLAILKTAEHLAGLYRILGNQDNDQEWQNSQALILEYLGLSEFDYEDLEVLAADNGIGSQTYFI